MRNQQYIYFAWPTLKFTNTQHCPTGTGGMPATVGLNAGDGTNFVNVTGTNTNDIINIASTTNMGITGMWAFKVNQAQITGTVHDSTTC